MRQAFGPSHRAGWMPIDGNRKKPCPSSLTGDTSHVKKPIGKKSRENIRNTHSRPEPTQSDGELMVFVEVRQIQDDLGQCQSWSESHDDGPWPLTSGMNPPCSTPSSALQTRNDSRPLSQNCAAATKLQRVSCIGIHLSGPIHLETSCEGSSEQRNASLNTVFPRL